MRPRPGASPRASAGNGAVGCLRLTPCKRPHRRGLSQGDGGHTAVALSAPATRNGSTDVVFGQAVAFSFPTHASVDRRSFLAASSMLCLTSGVLPKTHKLVAKADAHARSASAMQMHHGHMGGAVKDPVDSLKFGTPEPQPGGSVREYWISATSVKWNIAPSGRDGWMKMAVPRATTFRAFAYQLYSPGFARPLAAPSIPGPVLEAEVGDVIVVHLRNADKHFGQAITMHPHGVRYTPDYDGSHLGDYTRAGGFVAPGEEFKYTWECLPSSVGVWPYHDHGPNATINTARGLFGSIIVREKGAPAPDVEHVLFMHSFPPPVTGLRANFECINGRAWAGNT